jgi:hypothetical protein
MFWISILVFPAKAIAQQDRGRVQAEQNDEQNKDGCRSQAAELILWA